MNRNFFSREYFFVILLVLAAVFLRSWKHHDFLIFQSDQSRDAVLVSDIIQKGESLPLLGPQARGSDLLLGPAFYYFQTMSAFFFGDRPEVLAWPDLFFSILFVALLYPFFRLYFSKKISIFMAAIGATSLFLVVYSRFAWNPNSLPFFSLLSVFSLLKSYRDGKTNPFWLVAACVFAAVSSQLHFIFLLVAPIIFVAFFWMARPRFKVKHYLFSIGAILIIYAPVITSEIKTSGENTKAFFETVLNKGSKDEKHNILEKGFRAAQETQRAYWGMITSDENGKPVLTRGYKLLCDKECRSALPFFVLQGILFFLGIFVLARDFLKADSSDKKTFLAVFIFWVVSLLVIFTLLAYQISPRFFLLAAVPFLVMAGATTKFFLEFFPKRKGLIFFLVVVIVLFSNIKSDWNYFFERSDFSKKSPIALTGTSFMDDEGITLSSLEKTADYIAEEKSNGEIRIVADNRYARSVFYLLEYQKHIPACYMKLSGFNPTGTKNYFLIAKKDSNRDFLDEFSDRFVVIREKEFGRLAIYRLEGKNEKNEFLESEEGICYDF